MSKRVRPRPTRARLGQHFLQDASVLHRIVEFFHPQPGDRVVEIGAGRGALTKLLAPALAPNGLLTALEPRSAWNSQIPLTSPLWRQTR
jgi:16S rRNA A1518/A1519 N6-dimethyltransferase RsmA/KsgA/DIM1 with predicted DNA glycosylase/AP lyase activity